MNDSIKKTSLPKITADTKDSTFTGYVNAYVTSAKTNLTDHGNFKKELWYLSFVLPKGHGVTGQAIANSLFVTSEKSVYIEGVGQVVLGSRMQAFQSLGYSVHWNYRCETVAYTTDEGKTEEFLHCIVESNIMTIFDPTLADAEAGRKGRQPKKVKERAAIQQTARKKVSRKTETATTYKDAPMEVEVEETKHKEENPFFLMLIPGPKVYDKVFIADMHRIFLGKRAPFDLRAEWAEFLWERANRCDEIMTLSSWSYVYVKQEDDTDLPMFEAIPGDSMPASYAVRVQKPQEAAIADNTNLPYQSVIGTAYLCRPDIAKMHKDLSAWLMKRKAEREAIEAAAQADTQLTKEEVAA